LFIYTAFPNALLPFAHKAQSAHTSTEQIAVVLQSNYEWGTCSRSLQRNCLRQGSKVLLPILQDGHSHQSATMPQDNNNEWGTCPRLLRSGLS